MLIETHALSLNYPDFLPDLDDVQRRSCRASMSDAAPKLAFHRNALP